MQRESEDTKKSSEKLVDTPRAALEETDVCLARGDWRALIMHAARRVEIEKEAAASRAASR